MIKSASVIELPGLVDIHVHLREPGATNKEDFSTGTQAAVAGGYTQILDMPNNELPTITPQDLEDKTKLAGGRIWCDVGFNFGATRQSSKYFAKIARESFGLKVYMNHTTGPLLVNRSEDRDIIFKSWTSPLPIMVHAEGETIEVAIKLAKKYKKSLHVCHVTYDQIRNIQESRAQGLSITCEVCPHHLFLNKNDTKSLGPLALVKPSLPTKIHQQKLWDNLDKIDVISTDHAPHTLLEKQNMQPAYGVPGLETALPLMLLATKEGKLTMRRLVCLMSTNPSSIFKLPRQGKTYIVIDPSPIYKISSKRLFTKCGWTPFAGQYGMGVIKKVTIRNKVVFQDGEFVGKPLGKLIKPS